MQLEPVKKPQQHHQSHYHHYYDPFQAVKAYPRKDS
jgi:hypothetical protein